MKLINAYQPKRADKTYRWKAFSGNAHDLNLWNPYIQIWYPEDNENDVTEWKTMEQALDYLNFRVEDESEVQPSVQWLLHFNDVRARYTDRIDFCKPNILRQRLCIDWAAGYCRYGQGCRHVHGQHHIWESQHKI